MHPYKMHQYLLGHEYWSYNEGVNEVVVEPTHKDFLTWEEGASRVLHCLAPCMHDQMLNFIMQMHSYLVVTTESVQKTINFMSGHCIQDFVGKR